MDEHVRLLALTLTCCSTEAEPSAGMPWGFASGEASDPVMQSLDADVRARRNQWNTPTHNYTALNGVLAMVVGSGSAATSVLPRAVKMAPRCTR